MKRLATSAVLLASLLVLAGVLIALSNPGPAWAPTSPFTNNTLNCSWAVSADVLAQNITLLKNDVPYTSTYQNLTNGPLSTYAIVDPAWTARGEKWSCSIILYNETASATQEASVTILNSPPTTEGYGAGIFNSSATDVGYLVQIVEDTVMILDVNASDGDNDMITYLHADEFCTRISSAQGTYTCAPSQSNLVNNNATLVNITFTATDGQNVGGRTITFNVIPSNDAPAIALAQQTTAVNTSLNYTFTATDEENNYPFSYSLDAPAEIAGKLSIATLNANGNSVSIYYDAAVPDFNDIGLWTINITINDTSADGAGVDNHRSAVFNFTLNITPVGRRPYFTNITPSGPYVVPQGGFAQINITANDPDANSTLLFLVNTNRMNITTLKADTNTSDAQAQINFTPTNADVGVYNVTVTVRDATTLTNTTILQFNVTNVNDAPTISEMSYSAQNTQGNNNASNLTGFANTLFVYFMNATDPDLPYGDAITYSSNSTIFSINSTTGKISFTPSDALAGTGHTINVTVTDAFGLRTSRLLTLQILANRPPYFSTPVTDLNCTTKAACILDLSGFVADPDAGDAVAQYVINFTTSNLSSFAHNASSGLINFTTNKTDIGNYTVNLTIVDTHGAYNWTLMRININNTPEAPNLTRYDFAGEMIVEAHLFMYELQAADDDFLVASANENVTFTTNLSIPYTITRLATTNSTARALLSFTPDLGTNGTYTILINATDAFGLRSSKPVTFTIYPKVPPPVILNITPYGNDAPMHEINTGWAMANETRFAGNKAYVVLPEGMVVLFNVTINDSRPNTYVWEVNGVTVSTAQSYTRTFDYFSAGNYTVQVNISNDRLESTFWTWNLSVVNVNRPPTLVNPLVTPIVVNGTFTYSNYFTVNNGVKFLDPDDDRNSNGALDPEENSTLRFSALTVCPVALVSVSGSNLVVIGTKVGTCEIVFNATDPGGFSAMSNSVSINVTDIPQGSSPTPTVVSSGGGGSSASTSTYVPITKKVEKPQALNIIAPKLVTIYDNKSVEIPIIINNTWTSPLKMVRLSAKTNVTGVSSRFDTDLFEEIPMNQSREVVLTISNYRVGGNYEIMVSANVTTPDYRDDALILLNSIEQSSEGEDVNVKVTFANDLVNEHPECQELNEVLDKAKQQIASGNINEGSVLVDSVINGCKYLVSTQQRVQEKPSRLNPVINIDDMSVKSIMLGVLAFIVLSSIAFLIYYHYSHKPEDDI